MTFLKISADERIQSYLRAIRRAEDIKFSPNNSHIAIADYSQNRIFVFGIVVEVKWNRRSVHLTSYVAISSDAFELPHGIAWLDEATLVIASRKGHLSVLDVRDVLDCNGEVHLQSKAELREKQQMIAPGSVCTRKLSGTLAELLVCDNVANRINSYVIDRAALLHPPAVKAVITEGLDLPDGIALSPQGNRMAISNHNTSSVLIFRDGPSLTWESPHCGKLVGVGYPHGVRFSPDGKRICVADAGSPFLYIYTSTSGDWSGDYYPDIRLRVYSDRDFLKGRSNPQEGGPKGLDFSADGSILLVASELEPMVAIDLRSTLAVLPREADRRSITAPETDYGLLQTMHELNAALRKATNELRDLRTQIAELKAHQDLTRAYEASLSDGIDFTRAGWPHFVDQVSGLSELESWGRWSDGPSVKIMLKQSITKQFTLELTSNGFGPNCGQNVLIKVGTACATLVATKHASISAVQFDLGDEETKVIEILPPSPLSPASLGLSADARRLGLGFIQLRINSD